MNMNDYLNQRSLDREEEIDHSVDVNNTSKQTPHTFFIALSGKKQVGKDTATAMLKKMIEASGRTVAVTAFAASLKEMCINILGLKRESVYGTDAQKNELCHIAWDGFPEEVRFKYSNVGIIAGDGVCDPIMRTGQMTNREVLQVMGTDIFRAILNNVWAQAPYNKDWQESVVILTDCRFPNEKLVTEQNGGVIIRLDRNTGMIDNHPSEMALDDYEFKYRYVNDGSLEDLQNFLASVLKELYNRS